MGVNRGAKSFALGCMVENRKKHRQNSHLIIHCPTSEEVSEASERANGRASGPVLLSVFLVVLAHSDLVGLRQGVGMSSDAGRAQMAADAELASRNDVFVGGSLGGGSGRIPLRLPFLPRQFLLEAAAKRRKRDKMRKDTKHGSPFSSSRSALTVLSVASSLHNAQRAFPLQKASYFKL